MLKNTRVQLIAVLAIGVLLGYAAASGKLDMFGRASGEQSRQSVADKEIFSVEALGCCSEGLPKGQLLAQVDTKGGQQGEAITITVRLPADAVLEIDGHKTESTGALRTFQTPPLPAGKEYSYTLKATSRGKEVTRKIDVAHGGTNSIDLRDEFRLASAAKPAGERIAGYGQLADGKKPNILFIMGDDIGWMQPGCYHRGLMVGETPNIDRIAKEGAMFMHYYAEESCTAGRTAFITGMQPYRAGMLLPMLPGAICYLRPGTPSIAKFLLDLGYTTGEFGKNHLGDHADSLPTAHGFQEYWGYLYHLDAMQAVSFPRHLQGPEHAGHCAAVQEHTSARPARGPWRR